MWKYSQLSYTLAGLFYQLEDSIRIIIASGLNPAFIQLSNSAINNWTFILKDAENRNKIKDVITAVVNQYPNNPYLSKMLEDEDTIYKSVYSGSTVSWKTETDPVQLEKIINKESTLLPISFLEIGLIMSKSVARVVTNDSLGTGFLVSNNYFMTNNHVIPDTETAKKSKIQFNYQQDKEHNLMQYNENELDPDNGFATSPKEENDWTLIKVKGDLNIQFGNLILSKKEAHKNDFVNIIQHPGGEHKQIGLYHNVVAHTDERIIQYLTDTLPGSSGSPVFNSSWEVVALHHSGGWYPEPNSKQQVLRNEGINIKLVKKEANAKGIDF
jgi:V8-like Glu-specific endopeptidase